MENTDSIAMKDHDEPHDLVYDSKIKDLYEVNFKKEWREETEWMCLSDIEKLRKLGVEPTKSDSNDSYYNYYHIDAGDLTLYQVIMMFNYGRRIFFSEQCRQKIQTDQQNQ